ncbi:MAG: protein kinase domain-containing protein [Myxococcota bacterium]
MEPPIRIPGIETQGELGRGAYSVVFRARHGHTPCAVKVPRWRGRSHGWFHREAVALARVKDPGLPAVMEVGEVEGVPYLVMELAEGESLADRLRRGPLPEEEVVVLALQLARTLSAVHRRGLVHRDIKPSNIVLEPRSGLVRLVDFGFVTQIDRPDGEEVAGTRAYCPPEQMDALQGLDARADLYALGIILHECLTGSRPPTEASGADPVGADVRLVQAGASPALRSIVLGLVAPSPANRYASASTVLRDLERLQAGLAPMGPAVDVSEHGERLPLFNRDDELELLGRRWREASQGRGSVLLIEGAPGSGKTRLLAALRERIRAAHVLSATCEEQDPGPLSALTKLLDGYVRSLAGCPDDERRAAEDALRTAAGERLGQLVALASPALSELLGHPEVGVPARHIHEAFVESMAEFIRRLVRRAGPILLCVDDLQWADPVSRDVLVRVAHRASDVPLLLVAAARDDGASKPAVDRFRESLGEERLGAMTLGPLDETAVAELLASYLGMNAVDPVLVHRIASLSDGTPLSVLEILEAFLDHGALAPHWGTWRFDVEAADGMRLPGTTIAILQRRLAQLPAASRRMLEAAAVLGTSSDADVLAAVVGVDPSDLEQATTEVRRAGLLEQTGRRQLRFWHDRVREALLSSMPESRQRELHVRVARVLDDRTDAPDRVYELARHCALGAPETDAARAFHTCRTAAERAASRFDNDTALKFFDWAGEAAARAGLGLDAEFHRRLGETQLRVGALEESLVSLRSALGRVRDPVERADVLGRVAWVHQMRADPDEAWAVLDRAFAELGARLPEEDARSLAQSLYAWMRAGLRRGSTPLASSAEQRRLEVLCDLHYQNARLGLEYARISRFLQSTLRVLDVASRLGVSPALAKSYAMYGFAMVALGRQRVGLRYLDRAQTTADETGDPVTFTYCRQLQTTARYWTGDLEAANEMSRRLLHDLGHWLEASEYCILSNSPRSIEAMRGRPLHEWSWAEMALERIRRSGRAPAAFLVSERGAQAALTALGRQDEIPALWDRLHFVARSTGMKGGFFGLVSWGARIRSFTERGLLDQEFEREVEAFEAEGHDARSAHVGLYEYYVHVAHARAHQCFRASAEQRPGRVARLKKAVGDLRGGSRRMPLIAAHLQVLEGIVAFFDGAHVRARKHFDRASKIADEQNAPWVLYAVARAEAHLLHAEGRHEAARERARIAAMLAREHGAVHRLRWIGEEFDLRASSPPPPRSTRSEIPTGSSRRRQLETLLHVVRASSRDLHLEEQARAVLAEVVQTLTADRGLLVYEHEHGQALRIASGTSDGPAPPNEDPAVRRVQETGEAWIGGPLPAGTDDPEQTGHVIAAPLVLKERIVGAVSLQRDRLDQPFTSEDRDLLVALAYQVLSALELTRLLEQRERLEDSLRQAQKMEAVGRLAGGIAHDFNNMLTVIEASVEALRERPAIMGEDARPDLEMIEDAAQRAKTLTRQLLAFSRRQVVHPEVHDPNAILSELAPMLRRLIGEHIKVELQLGSRAHPVKVDRSFFEQAVVNLAANARDAMPKGGRLTLMTRNVELDPSFVREHVGAHLGEHVHLAVSDTGEGMDPEVQARIFDPFFTTKQLSGTGLGLSTVYGFATQSHGHIEVESELGRGTTFHLYLPRTTEPLKRLSSVPPATSRRKGTETVLLVEDERLVRNSVRRILQRAGYHVLAAEGAREALALTERHGESIALIVTDVLMPDVSGPELVTELRPKLPDAKVLYMSGYTDGHLVAHGVLEHGVSLLHKPFTSGELQERIRVLLEED